MIYHFPTHCTVLTLPGRFLDNIRLPQRQHRLQRLHALPRLNLRLLTLIRRLRDRGFRVDREQLLDPSRCYREHNNADVLWRADVV